MLRWTRQPPLKRFWRRYRLSWPIKLWPAERPQPAREASTNCSCKLPIDGSQQQNQFPVWICSLIVIIPDPAMRLDLAQQLRGERSHFRNGRIGGDVSWRAHSGDDG